jgi:hypothetical protein
MISSGPLTSRGPARRVTTARVPTAAGAAPSRRTEITLTCESAKWAKSVAYAKTSYEVRAISVLCVIAAIPSLLPSSPRRD